MLIEMRIEEILQEKGKTRYWLNKRMGMGYASFKKMVENETNSIRFETLEKLCEILEVPVGDLFRQTQEGEE